MANVSYERRWCPDDRMMVRAERKGVNHTLHLLLTVLTAGIWAIVWAMLALETKGKPWVCPHCGGKTVSPGMHHASEAIRDLGEIARGGPEPERQSGSYKVGKAFARWRSQRR